MREREFFPLLLAFYFTLYIYTFYVTIANKRVERTNENIKKKRAFLSSLKKKTVVSRRKRDESASAAAGARQARYDFATPPPRGSEKRGASDVTPSTR